MGASDRLVSYGFLKRLTIGLILTCAWRLGTVTCQNSQKGELWQSSFTVRGGVNVFPQCIAFQTNISKFSWRHHSVRTLALDKSTSWLTVNNERAVLASKQLGNHDIHGQKKKLHSCSYSGPGISEKTRETKGCLAAIKKLKALTQVKETASVIISCQKTFAET